MAVASGPGYVVTTSDNMLIGIYEDESVAQAAATAQVYPYVKAAVIPAEIFWEE